MPFLRREWIAFVDSSQLRFASMRALTSSSSPFPPCICSSATARLIRSLDAPHTQTHWTLVVELVYLFLAMLVTAEAQKCLRAAAIRANLRGELRASSPHLTVAPPESHL